jgi:hypothetical protein
MFLNPLPTEAGIASALVSASQQIGGAIGFAVLGTVVATATRQKASELAVAIPKPSAAALTSTASAIGYQSGILMAAGVLGAAFLAATIMIRPRLPSRRNGRRRP